MFGNVITVTPDAQAFTFQMSIEKLANSSIAINNAKAFSYMAEELSNTSINVEVIAIVNDKFFHNFCSWMFTPRSVFILTFDTKKLSESNTTEMTRLCALANTVSSVMSVSSENLQLFGMKPPGHNILEEEVTTLFLTNLAPSLHPKPKPKIISQQSMDSITSFQEQLFSLLEKISHSQKVHSLMARVIDQLITTSSLIFGIEDIHEALSEWVTKSPDVNMNSNDMVNCVIEDLKETGNLRELSE